MKRRVLLLSLASLLLAFLLDQLNHYLGAWQVHVWCGGLFVAFAALRLDFRSGAAASFIGGLILDAGAPVAFGTHALLFLAAHAAVFNIRSRAPREETIVGVIVALLVNLGLFLALSFIRIDGSPDAGAAWLRDFADLLASQLLIALVAPWFFAVQARLLRLGGADFRVAPHGAL
jgi:rod shape-determining protein MreD